MFASPKRILAAALLAALAGCGGQGAVENPAHFRFFNAFPDAGDVRVYVGDHLYSAGNVGPALSYGNRLAYGDVPSGTQTITVNPYIDFNTTYASLTGQAIVQGSNYTVVGITSGTAKSLVSFSDLPPSSASTEYFRIINAASTHTSVYVTLRRVSTNTNVYQSTVNFGISLGTTTGYLTAAIGSSASESYVLNVYPDNTFTTSASGDVSVDLQAGSPKTMIVYDNPLGGVSVRVGTDVSG